MAASSRAESQERTRTALVDTAREMFLRTGYVGTSLDAVADAAGFSKGAVYSNFRNKDELCLAVLDDIYATEIAEIEATFSGAGGVDERLAAFEAWAHRVIGVDSRTILGVDFAMRVRDSPRLCAQIATLDARMARVLADLVTRQAAELNITPLLPADVLASALLSLGIGIAVQRVVNPDFSVRVLLDTMRALCGLPVSDG